MAGASGDGDLPSSSAQPGSGYQILVGLLGGVSSRGTGEAAASLIAEFGSLPAVLAADALALRRVIGDSADLVTRLGFVRSAMLHTLSAELTPETILCDVGALQRYLSATIGYEVHEQVRVLFLNSANHLLRDETVSHGSASSAPFEARHIMRRAVELGASALIVAHNHPSGNPEPSGADLRGTRSLIQAGEALGIVVHDHVVLSRGAYRSFREMRLI